MNGMKFGTGRAGVAVRREAARTAAPCEGPVVVEIPASMFRAINLLRCQIKQVRVDGAESIRDATFAEALTSVLEEMW